MENTNGPSVKVLNDRSLTIVRKIANDWQKLTPKRQTRKRYMKYEEMLMQEIPGASKKTNQAMHAVLESDLEDTEDDQGKGMGATVKVRNHALIHYIAQLASSNNDNDTFDFSFVESLIKNGADINARDKHGQTIFHEVSRSWHLDVAQFLLKNGVFYLIYLHCFSDNYTNTYYHIYNGKVYIYIYVCVCRLNYIRPFTSVLLSTL